MGKTEGITCCCYLYNFGFVLSIGRQPSGRTNRTFNRVCLSKQVHIALDDQTIENGTLHYIPGSHR